MVQRQTTTDRSERMCSNRVGTGLWGKGTANAREGGTRLKAGSSGQSEHMNTWGRVCAGCQETGWEWGRKSWEELLQGRVECKRILGAE